MAEVISTATIGGIAIKTILAKSISEIYSKLKVKSKFELDKVIDNIYSTIDEIKMVKTLWQTEKSINIDEFYCEQHAIIEAKRVVIKNIRDISVSDLTVIEGIAGQGKSILLRYLASRELEHGRYIPVFIELRKIKDNQSLIEMMIENLIILGLKGLTLEDLRILCSLDRVYFLLDGFDEVSKSKRDEIVNELEVLAKTFKGIKIIITTRPRYGLETSPYTRVIELSNVINNEYKAHIYKLSANSDAANQLIDKVEGNQGGIKQLLCTPLLITLLIITYKSTQLIPDTLTEFYDQLLTLLIQRHDGLKPSYTRKKECAINDTKFRQVFETLCFMSKKCENEIFTHEELYDWAHNAITYNKITIDPDLYIKDVVDVTCLILREGNDYRFIHKTMREFYTASHIKRSEDKFAKTFYAKLKHFNYNWMQELKFLYDIDKYRYIKYLQLELAIDFFNIRYCDLDSDFDYKNEQTIEKILSEYTYIKPLDDSSTGIALMHSNKYYNILDTLSVDILQIFDILKKLTVIDYKPDEITLHYNNKNILISGISLDEQSAQLPLVQLYRCKDLVADIDSFASNLLDKLYANLKEYKSYISFEDSKANIIDELFV